MQQMFICTSISRTADEIVEFICPKENNRPQKGNFNMLNKRSIHVFQTLLSL